MLLIGKDTRSREDNFHGNVFFCRKGEIYAEPESFLVQA